MDRLPAITCAPLTVRPRHSRIVRNLLGEKPPWA